MSTNNSVSKKGSKKFNLIFFIDSEKTYHYKLNLFFVKFVLFFLFLLLVISSILIYFSLTLFQKNQIQDKYIISFKKSLLQYSFEKNLMKDDNIKNNEFVMNFPPKEEVKKVEVKKVEAKKEEAKKEEAKKVEAKKEEAKKEETKKVEVKKEETKKVEVKNEEVKKEEVLIIENSGIKIENPKILPEVNKTRFVFSLSNTNLSKNSISGKVCAVIIGLNQKGENIIYKIPEEIKLNNQNIPFSCDKGEQVRFSRLRPTEFSIKLGKNEITIQKVNIYFSYIGSSGIVSNSF
jgi:hypothetical protein